MEVESDDDYEDEIEEVEERKIRRTAEASTKKTGGIFSMFK